MLFEFGPVAVPTHEAFIVAGAAAATAVFVFEARRRGRLDERIIWIALGALFFGAVFAKLGIAGRYLTDNPDPSFSGLWIQGGRSVLGGLAGAYFGALLVKRIVGYRTSTGDLFAPAIAIGMAIGRFGCFLTEQIGTPTSLPWGISVSPATAASIPNCPHCVTGEAMHPSFLYEIGFHLVLFALLWRLRDRPGLQGHLFTLYLATYALFRFSVEFVRGNPQVWAGLTGSQLFLLVTAPLLAASLWRLRSRRSLQPLPQGAT